MGGGGCRSHERRPPVAAQVVLVAPGGGGAFALHILVEVRGPDRGGTARRQPQLGIVAEKVDRLAKEALLRALAIRPIGEGGDIAVLGDGDQAVFAIIDQAAGQNGPCSIGIIGGGVAIGVVAHRRAPDARWCMRAARRQRLPRSRAIAIGIDKVGVRRAEAGELKEWRMSGDYCSCTPSTYITFLLRETSYTVR